MDLSLARLIKTGTPGLDNQRIYCNTNGVFIGPDCALIQACTDCAGRRRYKVRTSPEIACLVDAGCGTHFGLDSLMASLNVIAKAIDLDHDVFGDFRVCPFTPERPGRMPIVCVDSAAHLERRATPNTGGK